MKRTTIYLDADLDIQLKMEAMRSKRSSVDIIREALRAYLDTRRPGLPEGVGMFESAHTDTAERAEEILLEEGFGED